MIYTPDSVNSMSALDAADSKYRSATRVASGTCSAFLAFYLFTGAVPAMVLGRLVYQKITRLQNSNKCESTMPYEPSYVCIAD